MFNINKDSILVGVAVLAVIITGFLILANSSSNDLLSFLNLGYSAESIAKKAVDYLNNSVLQGEQTAAMEGFSEESGVVKIKVKIGGKDYDSYVTKDGKLFFPEALKIEESSVEETSQKKNSTGDFNITEKDHVRGNFSASITLVEFSDFECPFCRAHNPTLKKILSEHKDNVRLVYKHFPLSAIHPNAQKAAEASECADEQGKFWEYHDKLFENQQNGLSIEKFKKWARELNLNGSQFDNCLDNSKYEDKVKSDYQEGLSKGVSGTPATFVNGELVSGAVPYENFKQKIDAILK